MRHANRYRFASVRRTRRARPSVAVRPALRDRPVRVRLTAAHRAGLRVCARRAVAVDQLAAAVTDLPSGDDQTERAGRARQPRHLADPSARQPDERHDEHAASEVEERLARLLVRLEHALGDDLFDLVSLPLARLHGEPGAGDERAGDGAGQPPRAHRAGTAPDCPERSQREQWEEHREHDREVYDRRVQRIGNERRHVISPTEFDHNIGSAGRRGYQAFDAVRDDRRRQALASGG